MVNVIGVTKYLACFSIDFIKITNKTIILNIVTLEIHKKFEFEYCKKVRIKRKISIFNVVYKRNIQHRE